MRVRVLKGFSNRFGKYPIGRILILTNSYAGRLMQDGIVEKYTGPYPPKKKMKTDFFKPKEK